MNATADFGAGGHGRRAVPSGVDPRREAGFALVITALLVGMLVLLLASLAALTRIETAVTRNGADLAAAQRNALIGLNVALGKLQSAAGPDQRVTALGELVGAGQRRWTGVWDSRDLAAAPVWLVSGHPGNANTLVVVDGATPNGVRLVGPNTVGTWDPGNCADVLWEELAVDNPPGVPGRQRVGRYAYWIGDEGVKGNVAVVDRVDRVPVSVVSSDPITTAAQRARLRQLLAHRAGNDAVAELDLRDERAEPARWAALERTLTFNQLRFGLADTTARRNTLRDHYHDFTVQSCGLLTNTPRGGLRINYSETTAAPAWINDFDRVHPEGPLAIDPGTAASGANAAQIKPVVTEWTLDVVIARGSLGAAAGVLGVGYRIRMEVWNPFAVALRDGPGADLSVQFTGLPTLEVVGPDGSHELDLGSVVAPALLDLGGDLGAGELRVLQAPVVQFAPTTIAIADPTPADPADDRLLIRWTGPAEGMRMTCTVTAPASPARPLYRLTDIPFRLLSQPVVAPWALVDDRAFPSANPDAPLAQAGLRFHVRASNARTTWTDWVDPARGARDLGATDFVFRDAEWESVGDDIGTAGRVDGFNPTDPIFAAGRRLIVRDFLLQRNVSLGVLSQASLAFGPPLAVGNFWGGEQNRIFDEAFFNPVSVEWRPGDVLPNTRHRVLRNPVSNRWPTAGESGGAGAARFLAVDGGFNVNSTSAPAWALALGRSNAGWTDATGAAVDLENPFFYFPQSAGLVASPNAGRRTLPDSAIQLLATRLRAALLARRAPFGSLEEWVNSGVLQTAIDEAGLNTTADFCADVGGPPARFSPDYLTQATILNALAPLLSVRSDTFVIRAYGECINPALSSENNPAVASRAWCEAVAQRVPDYVDPADDAAVFPPARPDNQLWGRRFRIVAFRWLTPDDI